MIMLYKRAFRKEKEVVTFLIKALSGICLYVGEFAVKLQG